MTQDSMVVVRDLMVAYGKNTVLSRVDLDIAPGEALALMGPSGSGKSSLLACITGTLVPTSGRVQIAGQVVSDLPAAARADFRRRQLGLVFQSPDLLPELTIAENVALTLLFDGVVRSQALSAAEDALVAVGLAGHGGKRVDEISGGEAQRVGLARALVRPQVRLIVADEPTASLDVANVVKVTELLLSRARQVGAAVILATHDPTVAKACDRITVLNEVNAVAADARAAQ